MGHHDAAGSEGGLDGRSTGRPDDDPLARGSGDHEEQSHHSGGGNGRECHGRHGPVPAMASPMLTDRAHFRATGPGTPTAVSGRLRFETSLSGAISAKNAGESDERLFAVAAWRETELFTDSERAALALAEAMTRLADRAGPVPDDVWDQAAKQFDEKQLAGLVLWVAMTNLFNRLNTTTKQTAGAAW